MRRENSKWWSHEGESTDAEHRDGAARSSVEAFVMEVEPRGCVIQLDLRVNPQGEEPVEKAKPFDISKSLVWEAYLRVRSRKGAPGVDEESIEKFEENLKDNLYKLWNRMSSGSYFPAPVRRVEIPKKSAGVRQLGIPTVVGSDRPDGREDDIWSRCWSRIFTKTPMDFGRVDRLLMP